MGKMLVVALLLGFLTVAAGCGGGQPWGGDANLGDIVVTVSTPVEIPVESGEKSVSCGVTFKNKGEGSYSYSFLDFTMYDAEGRPYKGWMECGG
jgi:hypothetical protein